MASAVMKPSHAPSPSYVPRTISRPASPSLPSLTPKLNGMERRASQLRNEVTGKISEEAKAILKLLSNLPAPLPASLPPNFLTTSSPSPPSSSSALSFTQFVHSQPKSKRRRSSSLSSNGDVRPTSLGLGLGLSMSDRPPDLRKKRKVSPNPPDHLSSTPTGMASPQLGPTRKDHGRSGLRHEISDDSDKSSWSRDRWRDAGQTYRARALLLKRHGDAHQRSPSAQPQFSSLPHDPLKGLLCLTDAVLLWLYAYFCEEQAGGRVRSSPYNESAPLRDFVRKGWEGEMRRAKDDGERDLARAMVGLMHLIEAVVCYHLSTEQFAYLHRRGKELSTSTAPILSNQHESNTSYHLPSDLLPLISSSTTSSTLATTHLLTSRHHLSLRLLRSKFPETFGYAIESKLSDEALPAPGDNLGSARKLEVDEPERFSWPIELGMVCPVAHTVVFGRCLIGEMGKGLKSGWEMKLEA
ncbi:MAG: hypothetical protein TREMPRED_000599 [Tremellales sp. Tagirdzhanova-0007]|nr:MAG: hypothetical protein TREMPRED_000599 [Tremellales sp. Tagirdzhanova-0007]